MGLIEDAIGVVKKKEQQVIQVRKNTFKDLFKKKLNIALTDEEMTLDPNGHLIFDGIRFNYYLGTFTTLKVLAVKGKPVPNNFSGDIESMEGLGRLLINMGLDVPKISKCRWDEAWVGICNIESDQEFCQKHRGIKCGCGAQATHNCPNAGSLVCGRPLCDNCTCNT